MNYKMLSLVILCMLIGLISGLYYADYREQWEWEPYFNRTRLTKPNTMVKDYFANYQDNAKLTILDLGVGNGSDTLFLLKKGFTVYAVDFHEEAIKRIHKNIDPQNKHKLIVIQSKFEKLNWHKLPKFDAIIAIHSLSFVYGENFYTLWDHIYSALKPNGLIIASVFNDKLNWVDMHNMTLLNTNQINKLSARFIVIKNTEENTNHTFNLILKKPK